MGVGVGWCSSELAGLGVGASDPGRSWGLLRSDTSCPFLSLPPSSEGACDSEDLF